jgi:glyoxylase-like metal-dependent hydrolase (beta-lactamase superfamily II)
MTMLTHIDYTGVAKPHVQHFFDPHTWTLTYVVSDPVSRRCAIIDPVLDLDYPSGTLTTEIADQLIAYIRAQDLSVDYIIETHVHADHLTSALYLQKKLGGKILIGAQITTVQETFASVYNEPSDFPVNGSQFDVMVGDGDRFMLGGIECHAFHVPGHTPACMAYLFGDALFVGDTLFMPDGGTARCDFPGGDAKTLFHSIKRLLTLPSETRMFVCHDYQPNDRELQYETTVGMQRAENIHVNDNVTEESFVSMRETRDATLGMPTLILPSLQVNIRAGHLPPADTDGKLFLRVPINVFAGNDLSFLADDK